MNMMLAHPDYISAIHEMRAGRTDAAVPLLEATLARAPDHALAALNLGMALMDMGRLADAAPHLAQALAGVRHMAEIHFRLGRLAHLRGDLEGAREGYQQALLREAGHVPSLSALAVLERQAGSYANAEALLWEALLYAPDDATIILEQARTLTHRDNPERALSLLEPLLQRDPRSGKVGALWAEALLRQHGPEAVAMIESAALEDPLSAARVAGLATALDASGRGAEALVQWRLAEVLEPDDGQILSALGYSLRQQRHTNEATPIFERAIRLMPGEGGLRMALGDMLFRTHRFAEAREILDRAQEDLGHDERSQATLALVFVGQGLQEEAVAAAEAAGGENEMLLRLCSLGPYHPELSQPERLHAAATQLHVALSRNQTPFIPRERERDGRLRVGFLSSHFGTHPVGWLTLPGVENLPRDQFDIRLFSLGERAGPIGRRYKSRADEWVQLDTGIGETALVQRLRDASLDILVDLGGHGQGGSVRALRHRCAPVQIKWVGSQSATTGVPNIDWMLTDRWETPEGFEPFYFERLLRMPDGYVCYLPPPNAPAVAPAPALTRGHVTFGCFNNMAKLSPPVLSAWARIMEALPDSRLVLRTHALGDLKTREAFEARAAAAGLPLDRMNMHGAVSHEQLLAGYGDIDISLDPFPYTGGLTVCESLWMGVPVLTLVGRSFASRHAFSHISNIGLESWAEFDAESYVAQAIARARDPAALGVLRASLRERVARSPLCDAPRFGRNLGIALERVWREANEAA